jgi:hypothetical protein
MPGGKAPWFFSSAIVMMRRNEVKVEAPKKPKKVKGEPKVEESDEVKESKKAMNMFRNSGADIPIECVKQRFVRPFIKSETHINYDYGLSRYHGLFDMALALGVITGGPTYDLSDGTKLGYKKNIATDTKMWEDIIIPVLDPKIQEKFGFGNPDVTEMLNQLYVNDTDD